MTTYKAIRAAVEAAGMSREEFEAKVQSEEERISGWAVRTDAAEDARWPVGSSSR
jgi:hypothetical protein